MTNCRPSVAALAIVAGFCAACGGPSPVRPSAAPTQASTAAATSGTVVVFQLADGTMTLETGRGTITGTYSGQARSSGGNDRAQITVVLDGGTGAFAGVSGTLIGIGTGAFVGEGDFSVVLAGTVSTGGGSRVVRASVRGTSTLSCLNETTVVTQQGTGAISGAGRMRATFTHQLGSGGGCSA